MSDGTVSRAPAPRTRPPPWVWPSIALGLLYPALARSARLDVELLDRLPEPPPAVRRLPDPYTVGLVGAAVLVAVVFSLFRVGITNIYTESMVFMLLALAIGMFSPAAGLLLVLLHVPFDLFAASNSFFELEPLLPAIAGRAVSWWLLWLLVVAIPLMARALPGATLASRQPADRTLRTILAYLAGAVAAGVLLYIWVGAAPFLVRPAFTWSEMNQPTVPAIQPIQGTGIYVIVAGVVLVLLVTALRHRLGALDDEAVELSDPDQLDDVESEPLVSDQVEFVGRIAAHVLTVFLLGGLVTGALDVVLFFGAALVGQLLGTRLVTRSPLGAQLARIPWFIRFLGAFALTYVIGLLISNITFEPAFGSEFFPVALTVAIGLATFQVLLNASAPPSEPEGEELQRPTDETQPVPMGAGTAVLAALVLAGIALLATPAAAAADNCSGWHDACPATVEAAAAAGAGAAAVVAVGAALAASRLGEDKRRARRLRRRRGPVEPGAAAAAGSGIGRQRLFDRALRNYGVTRSRTVPPTELKMADVELGEHKAGELRMDDIGRGEQKAGELRMDDIGLAEQKAGEAKIRDAGVAQGGEMRLGDAGLGEQKAGELNMDDAGPADLDQANKGQG